MIRPSIDTRSTRRAIESHTGARRRAASVATAYEIFDLTHDEEVIIIDEAHLIPPPLMEEGVLGKSGEVEFFGRLRRLLVIILHGADPLS